jgi:hypothetical protein
MRPWPTAVENNVAIGSSASIADKTMAVKLPSLAPGTSTPIRSKNLRPDLLAGPLSAQQTRVEALGIEGSVSIPTF